MAKQDVARSLANEVTIEVPTIVMASILRSLGGSIVITAEDLMAGSRATITTYQNQDPPSLVISLREE